MADNHQNIDGFGNINLQGISGPQINVNQYLGKSLDYQDMLKRLAELQELFSLLPDDATEKRLECSQKIDQQQQLIESFKQDVLKLAETFKAAESLPPAVVDLSRINRARELFEAGKIREASAALAGDIERIDDERDVLIGHREEFEKKETAFAAEKKEYEENLRPKLEAKALEYMILARGAQLNYENPDWFGDTCRYFESSIATIETLDNLFEYAKFLQGHNQFKEAVSYYERVIEKFSSGLSPKYLVATLNNLGSLHSEHKRV